MTCKHCFHWTEAGEKCCDCGHLIEHQPNQAIERVRELHKEDNTGYCELCTAIATPDGSDYLSKYPCPTIKALDGESND
jgi:hypothetical protein